MATCVIPRDLSSHLQIDNAEERFAEALHIARRLTTEGIELMPNLDHAAIFTDPPSLVAGPIKRLGYLSGWDSRCYPSPVDAQDYINVSAKLPENNPRRAEGWPDYVAVVHPVDNEARDHMLRQGYGNPFIHHLTWGIVPPQRTATNDFDYAGELIRFMTATRRRIAESLEQSPGTLIAALPQAVIDSPRFSDLAGNHQMEAMEGGGFLLQFFVLTGGRIELALRVGTKQTFNPKSVYKISKDEISAVQS